MLKQATVFKIIDMPLPEFDVIDSLESRAFQPCIPSQEISHGWTPPDKLSLCECINGQLIMQFTTEQKKIPAAALKRKLNERCKAFESSIGRKPSKKETKEIKEELIFELLPSIIPTRVSTNCWVNPIGKIVVVDASPKRANDVASAMCAALTGLVLEPFTAESSMTMAGWLAGDESPESFMIGIDCDLASTNESKTRVKYVKHNLDIPEVVYHVTNGMSVKSVGLMWADKVYFTLNDDLSLKKIEFLETPQIEDATDFEANAYIETTEINDLIKDLIAEFSTK